MKSTSDTRKPYTGSVRSLVIAIDTGTTYSPGVSYSILEPGEVPKIHGVTRFPGQEHVAGNSKIPSILWYDRRGKMMSAGAEAETSTIVSQAEDEGWIKVELFKLRLRPRTMKLNMNGMRLGQLPPGKTAVDVFGDFLAYIFLCTRNFITDTHANGSILWATVEHDIKFVLSHPNGWEGAQQSKLRRAAIYGGLVPNTNAGKARIFFVTEGEASLHACVLNGLAADVLSDPSKPGFLIADAGGGTWDISAYSITGQNPLIIEEIAPPDCIFAGSVFVSRRARKFLEEKLQHSRYGSPEAVEHITKRFDETTKRLFRDDKSLQFISFGSPLDKDSTVGIRGGQLKLTGAEVRELFEPSIEDAFNAIKAQIDASAGVIKSVWLVGGFAANHWLFSQLQERLAPFNVTVNRPDSQTSKAVCDGAVGFYVDHHVSVRMSKAFYGVEFLRTFDPEDPEHVARESTLCELPSGPKLLPDAFDCILKRGLKVKESTIFSRKYSTELTSLNVLSVFEVLIWCYRGKSKEVPTWIYRDAEEFSTLCIVRADLSPLKGSAVAQTGVNGKTFWKIIFSVEIHFGLTEFKARIKWMDNGEVKYGPASIVYNERGRRAEEDEPDAYPEDDLRSERMRSPPPLSRPQPSARPDPVEQTNSVPEVARLPDELQDPRRGALSDATNKSSSSGRSDREASRGRRSAKDKGKEKEITPEESVVSRTSSTLADALTSVWGKVPSASPAQRSRELTPVDLGEAQPETTVTEPEVPSSDPVASKVPTAPHTPKVPTVPPTPKMPTVPSTPKVSTLPPTPKVPTVPPTPKVAELDLAPTAASEAEVPETEEEAQTPKPPQVEASFELEAANEASAPTETEAAPQDVVHKTSTPPTPKASKPPTPKASKPSTPKTSKPSTPKASTPPSPKASKPSTPKASTPPTPKAPAQELDATNAEETPSSTTEEVKVGDEPSSQAVEEVKTEESVAGSDGNEKVEEPVVTAATTPRASKRPTPLASPAPVTQFLADVAPSIEFPRLSPHMIELPLSTASSPKSSASLNLHSSPNGLLSSTVLPAAELNGDGPTSSPLSEVAPTGFNVVDVGTGAAKGDLTPGKTGRKQKKSRRGSAATKG